MASQTPYYGLNYFGPGTPGSITDDAGKFTLGDRLLISRILKALESHDHKGGAALADPTGTPPLALETIGGQLPGGVNVYYRISYIDQFGLETAASPEGVQATPTPIQPPVAGTLVAVALTTSGPGLATGNYSYALTALSGTDETPLGDTADVTTSGDLPCVDITFPDPEDTQDSWGIWRMGEHDAGWTKVDVVPIDQLDYVDDGTVPANACACDPAFAPPTENVTSSTNLITVSVPDPDLVALVPSTVKRWRLYRTYTSGSYPSNSLVAEVVTTVNEDGTGGLVTSFDDDGTTNLLPGAPLEISQCLTPSVALSGGGGGAGAGALQVRSTDGAAGWAVSCTFDGSLVTDPSEVPVGTHDVYLTAPNSATWKLTVNPDGSLQTTLGAPASGDQTFTSGVPISTPDATLAYLLTVGNDGALITTAMGVAHDGGGGASGGMAGFVQNPILTSPGGSTFVLNASADGHLLSQPAGTVALLGTQYTIGNGPVLIAPDLTTWRVLVGDDGAVVTVATEALPGDALYASGKGPLFYISSMSRWRLEVLNGGGLELVSDSGPVISPTDAPILTAEDGSHWQVVVDGAGDMTVVSVP